MIIKNKSFYRKFVDWCNNFKKDKPLITGSANIYVSLTYLRGLEIPELNEVDMPMI